MKVSISATIDEEVLEEAKKLCKEEHRNFSNLVEAALRDRIRVSKIK